MEYQFCPMCGEKYKDNNYSCSRCNYILYKNPVPAVGAIILNAEKQVLMVKRAIDPHKGKWEFVGGFVEYGEDAQEALKREIGEELQISAQIGKLLLCVTDTYGDEEKCTINLFYLAYIKENACLQLSDEIEDYGWFSVNNIPKEVAFNCTFKALEYITCNEII